MPVSHTLNPLLLMKKLLLTAALGTLAVGANAQLRFGAEVGAHLANQNVSFSSLFGGVANINTSPNLGLRGGLVAQFGILDHLSIQPAILFTMKGTRLELDDDYSDGTFRYQSESQSKINLNYIEIPLNIQYSLGDNGNGFFIGAGPYFGYAFAGKAVDQYSATVTLLATGATETIEEEDEYDVEFGDGLNDMYKNLDIGIGVNAGYMLPMGAFVRVYGQYGLSQVLSNAIFAEAKNYGFGLSVGYMIGN